MLRVRRMMKRQKGFTLVELIVVIAILGILAALVVPRFMNTLETQREKTDLANLRTVQSAYDIYLADHNGEPANNIDVLTVGGYLDELPAVNSKKFQGAGNNWGIDNDGVSVTYGGQTYSQWETALAGGGED